MTHLPWWVIELLSKKNIILVWWLWETFLKFSSCRINCLFPMVKLKRGVCNLNLINNTCCAYVPNDYHIKSKFCKCHSCLVAMTYVKLWNDLVMRNRITTQSIFTIFGLWAHRRFLGTVPEWPGQSACALLQTKLNTVKPVWESLLVICDNKVIFQKK